MDNLLRDTCAQDTTPQAPQLRQAGGTNIPPDEDLNYKVDWTQNTTALYYKGQSRLDLCRRLKSSAVREALLKTFYNSAVASATFQQGFCWGGSISAAERKRLEKLIRKASYVLGHPLDSLEVLGERRIIVKQLSITDTDTEYPMQDTLTPLQSSLSARLLYPKCGNKQYRTTAGRLHTLHIHFNCTYVHIQILHLKFLISFFAFFCSSFIVYSCYFSHI